MVSLDHILSPEIAGSVIFGTFLGMWIESTIPILVALLLGNPVTATMMATWAVWGVFIPPAALLLIYWSFFESNATNFINYVTGQDTGERRTDNQPIADDTDRPADGQHQTTTGRRQGKR